MTADTGTGPMPIQPGPVDWSTPTLIGMKAATGAPELPEPEPEPEADSPPEPVPVFTSVPVAAVPVRRRPRAQYQPGHFPSWHDQLLERAADAAVVASPIPLRVVDVGCGDGRLLAELILRVPSAELYIGVDPRPDAVSPALRATEPRLSVVQAAAEALPLPDASFDLVVAMLSLGVWLDQRAGVAELARIVSDNGKVVIVEAKKAQPSGRNRVRGVKGISELLESAGLVVEQVETLHRSAMQMPLAHALVASP